MANNPVDIKALKELREKTGAGVMDCRKALLETNSDMKKAEEILVKQGIAKAEKKSDRKAADGLVMSYIHGNGKVGVLLEINCETDFVARTDDFNDLAKEVAMQIAAMDPSTTEELMKQAYIRDASVTIEELVKKSIGKVGENIVVRRFTRYALGK